MSIAEPGDSPSPSCCCIFLALSDLSIYRQPEKSFPENSEDSSPQHVNFSCQGLEEKQKPFSSNSETFPCKISLRVRVLTLGPRKAVTSKSLDGFDKPHMTWHPVKDSYFPPNMNLLIR